MRSRLLLSFLTILLALTGCAANLAPDKGVEDNAPIDGKADSFREPTEHGDLRFGNPRRSSLSDDERFHAWTFALSGDAEVSMEIVSGTPNLDTLLYLYRRNPGTERWGSYIGKYDDHDGSLLSAFSRELGAGEYRIIVKGFKEEHRGPFGVSAECSGAGCEAPAPTDPIDVPGATSFTTDCVHRLQQALGAPVTSSDSFGIHPDTTEGFDREVLVATAHYRGMSDWAEYVYDDERDEFTFDVEVIRTEKGTNVELGDGGDESTIDYLFDAEGNLLAWYLHNQSPWVEFYCDQGGEERDPPTEDCVSAWITHGPQAGPVSQRTDTYEPGAPNDEMDELMTRALAAYQETALDGADDVEVRFEIESWESSGGGNAADMLLSAEGHETIAYTVVDSYYGEPWIVFESSDNDDEGPRMTCSR